MIRRELQSTLVNLPILSLSCIKNAPLWIFSDSYFQSLSAGRKEISFLFLENLLHQWDVYRSTQCLYHMYLFSIGYRLLMDVFLDKEVHSKFLHMTTNPQLVQDNKDLKKKLCATEQLVQKLVKQKLDLMRESIVATNECAMIKHSVRHHLLPTLSAVDAIADDLGNQELQLRTGCDQVLVEQEEEEEEEEEEVDEV